MNRQQLAQAVTSHGLDIFRINDLRKLFPDDANVKVSIKRMVDAGVVFSVARGIYALNKGTIDVERLATQVYYPSYISFESALSKYGIINQGLYGLTLATTRHSKQMTLAGVDCEYCRIKEALFFGYSLINGTYLASPEKACLDLLYLHSLGKRKVNVSEWIVGDLDRDELLRFAAIYPPMVRKLVKRLPLA